MCFCKIVFHYDKSVNTLTCSWCDVSNSGEICKDCEGKSSIMQDLCQVCLSRLGGTVVKVKISINHNGAIPERTHMQIINV